VSPEQIKAKLPPELIGSRIMPDDEVERNRVKIELNCVCGQILETCTYFDGCFVKIIVHPCLKCSCVKK
jgi:hypothetical protein